MKQKILPLALWDVMALAAFSRALPPLKFLQGMITGSIALMTPGLLTAEEGDGKGRSPNIILIMADDLGWKELGCYGQEKIKTPHIDRLAAEGMRFTQFYAGSAVCAPSRCNLMTGMHGGHAYIRNNGEIKNTIPNRFAGQAPLLETAPSIAKTLKAEGYATACFGKWGLGGQGTTGDPLRQGFDRFYGYNCQRNAHNLYPEYLEDDAGIHELEGNQRGQTGEAVCTAADCRSYDRFCPQKLGQAIFSLLPDCHSTSAIAGPRSRPRSVSGEVAGNFLPRGILPVARHSESLLRSHDLFHGPTGRPPDDLAQRA